jgi:hypothetical protein
LVRGISSMAAKFLAPSPLTSDSASMRRFAPAENNSAPSAGKIVRELAGHGIDRSFPVLIHDLTDHLLRQSARIRRLQKMPSGNLIDAVIAPCGDSCGASSGFAASGLNRDSAASRRHHK